MILIDPEGYNLISVRNPTTWGLTTLADLVLFKV
jgi:hypothetical protein